jgi:hypothetical protein
VVYALLIERLDAKGREQLDDALAEPDPVGDRERRITMAQRLGEVAFG